MEVLDHRKNGAMESKLEEQVVQEFSHCCPYCDEPVSYEQLDLKMGENKIKCPSCKKIYIKVVLGNSKKLYEK